MNYEWVTEFKPSKPIRHYTEDELPEQDEECFCDIGDFFKHAGVNYERYR